MMNRAAGEHGVAMLMAVMALLLMSALGAALILISSSETIIAGYFRNSIEAQYGADAMMALAVGEIGGMDDWTSPIAGSTRSARVDGTPRGRRALPDGSTIDLAEAVNLANCQKTSACSDADLNAVTADRPWGANNPRWRPYAYGPLDSLLSAASPIDSPCYVLLLVADDPTGTHEAPPAGGGSRWEGIAMRSEAFGLHGAHKVIEVVAGRTVDIPVDGTSYNSGSERSAMRILWWREVR
jgi:hypothetical protein